MFIFKKYKYRQKINEFHETMNEVAYKIDGYSFYVSNDEHIQMLELKTPGKFISSKAKLSKIYAKLLEERYQEMSNFEDSGYELDFND